MRSIRVPVLGLFFVFCLSSTCSVEAGLCDIPSVGDVVCWFVVSKGKEVGYITMVRAHAVAPLDMKLFEQANDAEQVAMMEAYINQYLITDGFIAWDLGLLGCTVEGIHYDCLKQMDNPGFTEGMVQHEMARRLVAKVRKMNFIKRHWGKLLIGAGVGAVAMAAGGLFMLNQFIYH